MPTPHFFLDGSGFRPCANLLAGENGGAAHRHFDAYFSTGGGGNFDFLSRLERAHHCRVYLAENPRINRQIFFTHASGVRGVPS